MRGGEGDHMTTTLRFGPMKRGDGQIGERGYLREDTTCTRQPFSDFGVGGTGETEASIEVFGD